MFSILILVSSGEIERPSELQSARPTSAQLCDSPTWPHTAFLSQLSRESSGFGYPRASLTVSASPRESDDLAIPTRVRQFGEPRASLTVSASSRESRDRIPPRLISGLLLPNR